MIRRQQTVYVSVDPFFSPRGKVLHRFDEFLSGLADAQVPCVWITGGTRAQLDEPRRRLGQSDPYVGESGSGVYLPEDYFHLKSRKTIRLGRYTCIPIAKPQPAAAEALEELAFALNISVVPLRGLSRRELSQNTGLPAKEAELIRMRDFDELFFFAGAGESEIARFQGEARTRGLTLQSVGTFWSLSCGANLISCLRELGALYDRGLRGHAARFGIAVAQEKPEGRLPSTAFDRCFYLSERAPGHEIAPGSEVEPPRETTGAALHSAESDWHLSHLSSPDVWANLLEAITGQS